MDECEDPESCLLERSHRAKRQAAGHHTARFFKSLGCSFAVKLHNCFQLLRKRDTYTNIRGHGHRGDEKAGCRWTQMVTTLARFVQTDRELELCSIRRARQLLYYA